MRLLLLLFTFTQIAVSQTVRLEQETPSPEVVVSEAEYKLNISGPLSEVHATITVYNEDAHEDKVSFFYKLPEDSTVTGFALDIKGKMRQASAIEKHKARIAFESEVRRKVDPALMEWNQGNIFQTQIYPVAANGSRKVTVSYIIPTKAIMEIPLKFNKLKKFSFTVSSKNEVSVESPIEVLKLSNADSSFVELRAENTKIYGSFKIKVREESQKLYTERNKDQNLYWIYKEAISVPEQKISLEHIKSIAVFQDSSLSRDKANLDKEVELLKGIIEELNKPVTLKLFRFNISSEFFKNYTIDSDESFKQFADDFKSCIADGGTDFSKLLPSVKLSKSDLKIIFSDGLNNYSNFSTQENTFTVNSSEESDSFTLKAFGGKTINLNELKNAEALKTFLSKGLQVKSNTPDTFGAVKNGQLIAAGILKPGKQAEFSIYQGDVEVKKVTVKPETTVESNIIRKYWSQNKLQYLMQNSANNKFEITELGKSHNLVTPYTSLIVLESLQQYLEHEIRPSDEEAELQALYDKRFLAKKPVVNNPIEKVSREWLKYKKWWEKYSDKKKNAPAIVKADENMTLIDRAIAQRRPETANEPVVEIYTEEYFNTVAANPGTQAPAEQEPNIPEESVKTKPDINDQLKELKLPEEKLKTITEWFTYFKAIISELNNENDQLKNDNGRLRADHNRLSRQLEELKELYVKDRSAGPRPPSKANADSITFTKWESNSSFIKQLKVAKTPYKAYLGLRNKYRDAPGFYFECAEFFRGKGDKNKASLILSNIIEISNRNPTLMRMAAYKMTDTEYLDEAIYLLREIFELRPEEPHSYRDLALALIKKSDKTEDSLVKSSLYTEALTLYEKVIQSSWYRENEFRGLTAILVEEYNNIILKSGKAFKLDPQLKNNLDMDLRVVISWDTDMADVDLHIVQPDGEKVYYGNRISKAGGRMSYDYTRGMGPETYGIRHAIVGKYKIYANIYSADALFFNGQISMKIDVYRNYGRPDQIHKSTTVKISETRKEIELATITVK